MAIAGPPWSSPLRLNFQTCPERIAGLDAEPAFVALPTSKKKDARGRRPERKPQAARSRTPCAPCSPRCLAAYTRPQRLRPRSRLRDEKGGSQVEGADAEGDPLRAVGRDCHDLHRHDGKPEPDPAIRDFESVPLLEDIHAWFAREMTSYVAGGWINETVHDDADGKVRKVGYDINFNRYFYKYQPPRPLEAIEASIAKVEKEILAMLGAAS